jgi:hypothetical protein
VPIHIDNIPDDGQLQPGIYTAQVIDLYEGMTRNNFQKITIVFSLTDEGFEGQKVYADYTLTSKAVSYLRKALFALGFTVADVQNPQGISVDDMRGRQCRIVIENTFGPQGTFSKVRQVLPPRIDVNQETIDIDF